MFVIPYDVGPYRLTPATFHLQRTAYLCYFPEEAELVRDACGTGSQDLQPGGKDLGAPFFFVSNNAYGSARKISGGVEGDAADVERWLAAWEPAIVAEYLPRLRLPLPSYDDLALRFEEIRPYLETVSKRPNLNGLIYCARKYNRDGVRDFPSSQWANRFPIVSDSIESREAGVRLYYDWLRKTPPLLLRLYQLRGALLGCWCAPRLCHTMPLAVLANHYLEYVETPETAGDEQ